MPLKDNKPNNVNGTLIPAGDGGVAYGRSVCDCDQQEICRDQTSGPACAIDELHAASGSASRGGGHMNVIGQDHSEQKQRVPHSTRINKQFIGDPRGFTRFYTIVFFYSWSKPVQVKPLKS